MIDHAGLCIEQGADIAAERVRSSENMMKSHYHTYYELYYLEEGCRLHAVSDQIYRTEAGEMILFPPYSMHHSYAPSEDQTFQRIVVYFTEKAIGDLTLIEKMRHAGGLYHPDRRMSHQIHGLLGMMLMEQSETDDLHDITMETILRAILLLLLKDVRTLNPTVNKSRVIKVIEYISDHYMEDLRLDELAGRFYVSQYYLCREFKKYTSRTINQYINTTRILNAQREIMETNHPFSQVAANCGFASSTHFSRVFRSVTGMTPTAFRKSCSQGQVTERKFS